MNEYEGYICPICHLPIAWESDADAEDLGGLAKGIISFYHCVNCGADIEILIYEKNPYKEEEK